MQNNNFTFMKQYYTIYYIGRESSTSVASIWKGDIMCKFLKRLFIFLFVVSTLAIGIYYFTCYKKKLSPKSADNANTKKEDSAIKKEPTKRHYTKLTLPTI